MASQPTLTAVDYDPFAKVVKTAPAPKLEPVDYDPFTKTSALGSAGRAAGRSVLPATGGAAAFGPGFVAGGLVTAPVAAMTGPFAPVVEGIGAFGGGLAAAMGAGYVVSKAQDKVLSLVPKVKEALGQGDAQRAADERVHPYATFAGEMAPNALFMRPGFSSSAVAPGASKLTRALASPVTGAAIGATVSGAGEGVRQAREGKLDLTKLGMATAFGGLLNRPTKLGDAMFRAGGNATIKVAQAGARTAGDAYRGATDLGSMAATAARDFRDKRSGALIEGELVQPSTAAPKALSRPVKLTPVENDPFAVATTDTPMAPPPGTALVLQTPEQPAVSTPSPPAVEPQLIEPAIPADRNDGLRPDPGPLADGEHYVTTPAGNRIRSRFEVVPAASLKAAEGDLQNRDRSRDSTELQTTDIVSNFDPSRLGESAESDRGSPIVGPDGTVESGNGRMLAINRIYGDLQNVEKAQAYKQFLISQGHDIGAIENPVLIRRRVNDMTDEQRRQFVIDSNKDAKLAMTAVERARSDADALDAGKLSLYKGGDISNATNGEFVKAFIGKMTPSERASFADGDGNLSQEGIVRVENALMARAYENPAVLSKLIEARDNNIRSIGGGMLDNAGGWATLRAAVKDGEVKPEFDVTDKLVEAARRVSDMRTKGEKIGDALSQVDAFNSIDPVVESFMRAFYNTDLSRAAGRDSIASVLAAYTKRASEQTTGARLFGGEDQSPAEILRGVLDERDMERNGGLFAMAAEDRAPRAKGDMPFLGDELEKRLAARKAKRLATIEKRKENARDRWRDDDDVQTSRENDDADGRDEPGDRRSGEISGVLPRGRDGAGSKGQVAALERPARSGLSSNRDEVHAAKDEASGDMGSDEPALDYSEGAPLEDKGAYQPKFEDASRTMRASIYDTAAREMGVDPDKFTLMPAPKQVEILQAAMLKRFGVAVAVDKGMQERFAIDQMTDAFQNVEGMAHVLGLPSMAMGLGGKLKLTLKKGARFLGSFQPGANIITLPQRSNSFAHEWGHAVDWHLMATLTDGGGKGLTGALRSEGSKVQDAVDAPPSIRAAFVNLLNVMFFDKAAKAAKVMDLETKIAATNSDKVRAQLTKQLDAFTGGNSQSRAARSDFYKGAASFDDKGDYWTSPTEMFARAFEAFVSFKAEATGLGTEFIGKGDANYLSNAEERFAKTFPKGEEREAIFAAFEDVFAQIATEQVLGKGAGATRPEDGTLRKITDFDRMAKDIERGGVIKRELDAFNHHAIQKAKEAAGRPNNPKGAWDKTLDGVSLLSFSMAARLKMLGERYNSAAVKELHKLLTHSEGSSELVGRTFHEAVDMRRTRSLNRLSNILKAHGLGNLDIAKSKTLRDLLISVDVKDAPDNFTKGAAAIRRLLDGEFYENQQAGIDIGYTRNGYLPRMLDYPKVENDTKAFTEKAAEVYGLVFDKAYPDAKTVLGKGDKQKEFMTVARGLAHRGTDLPALAPVRKLIAQIKKLPDGTDPAQVKKLGDDLATAMGELIDQARPAYSSERAQAWLTKIQTANVQDFDAHSPDSSYVKHRDLPAEADTIMQDFYVNDPVEAVTTYLAQSARRSEYARRFGADGSKRRELFERMAGEGVRNDDQVNVSRILDIATGRQASAIPQTLQGVLSFVHAAGTIVMLPRAVLSSLVEPITGGIRTGDFRDGFKALTATIAGALGSPDGKVRAELARAMGIVSDSMSDHVMEARFGGTYGNETRWDRKVGKMFQRTGLIALTRSQRTHMIAVSHGYLDNLSGVIIGRGGKASDARAKDAKGLLSELGIRDPEAFAREMDRAGRYPTVEELETPYGFDYSTASRRFIDQVIQNPSVMDRPEMANNPVGRVMYGIMSFSYAFWRNVIKRSIIRMDELDRRGDDAGQAKFMIGLLGSAAALFIMQTTISTMREFLLNRDRWRDLEEKDELEEGMLKLGLTRSFALGGADPFIQAYTGLKYQRDLSNVMIGAAPGYFLQNVQTVLNLTVRNSAKTNTGEYNALRALYQLTISPAVAFTLASIPGGPILGGMMGAGIATATAPAAGNAFAKAIVGPKDKRGKKKDSDGRGSAGR
jgi:hypothetical protein